MGGRKEIHRRQDKGRISLSSDRTKIHRRQERYIEGRREAGKNPGWSDEICPAFYGIVFCLLLEWFLPFMGMCSCLLIDCVLPFIGMVPAFYGNVFCLLLEWFLPFDRMGWRQDISPTWQERDTSKAGERQERIDLGWMRCVLLFDGICPAF